ncbi:IclR family transcriptional regulator [Parenemella sanctibonifatiensis]|uniref:ArsR family transcriptional regulator n=1 Tax=Parenemella sanctibonifatiensis TaxID=2016505 RepID=A0A255EIW7_9ACTN|nr:IclR family transcriptional regulator [Parenemella sanctibonifatiensis]OYN88083.1 ArsR family transcriptional regulator [Parenemella sanctibonifatiensis]
MADTVTPQPVVPAGGSPAASRTGHLLHLLAEEAKPMGLSQIARGLGLAKSSTLGLLTSLEAAGLVRRERSRYSLDAGVLRLASGFLRSYDVAAEFRHATQAFYGLSRELVQLAALAGTEVLYLTRHTGRSPLFVSAAPGDSFPAAITAVGTVLLAGLDDDEVSERYSGPDKFPMWTSESTANLPQLLRKLQRTRARGFAVDEGETNPGVVGIAVRVERGGRHNTPLAVGASLPRAGLTPRHRQLIIAELRELRDVLESGSTAAPEETGE